MKRTVSIALLFTLVLSAFIPTFAQKGRTSKISRIVGERTQFEKFEAFTNGDGATIRWQMKAENRNAGFFVYRIGKTGLELVDPVMTLGSFGKSRKQIAYGEAYEVYDPQGGFGATYVVESLGIDGRRLQTPAVGTKFTNETINIRSASNGNIEKRDLALTKDLQEAVRVSLQTPDLATHRWVVSQPGAKIGVKKEGFYRVTTTELQTAGFPIGSDSANWRLYMEGVEQAIIVGAGNQYIEFYGRGIDTRESDTRVYYLISDTVPGKRIQTRVVRPIGGSVTSVNYPVVAEKKERVSYVSSFLNGSEDNFWGRVVFSSPTNVPFDLTGVDLGSPDARITVTMKGFSNNSHLVGLKVNGHQLTSISGSGEDSFSGTYTIPSNFLVEGTNALELTSLNAGDLSLFDSITVQYARKYQADQNKVSFFTPGYRRVEVTGFTSPNFRIFDTTYDSSPQLLTNFPIDQNGGTFTAKLPSSRAMVTYGVEDSGLLQAPSVTANNPSTLATVGNNANLIIISHSAPDFLAAAESWANYRRGQGFTVKVVDVADVFDEFGYGVLGSASINSFLDYAFNNWQTQPQYVLLMGDGSYDPRNYEGNGSFDMVPMKFVDTAYEETGSDEALADFDNDGLAEMSIGRISARTGTAITLSLNKTMAFEANATTALSRGALFAYDVPNGFDFRLVSEYLRDLLLPLPMPPATMVGRGMPPPNEFVLDPNAQTNLMNGLNTGKYIVNYAGHGSAGLWASTGFFSINNVPQLTNVNNQSIFTMLTCLNGYFMRPRESDSCIAERLLFAQNGGSVVSWASSGSTTPDVQLAMASRFYSQVAAGNITRMGDLIRDAKSVLPSGTDVRFSWVLLGDPMLKIR